jgi:hypothetical protein
VGYWWFGHVMWKYRVRFHLRPQRSSTEFCTVLSVNSVARKGPGSGLHNYNFKDTSVNACKICERGKINVQSEVIIISIWHCTPQFTELLASTCITARKMCYLAAIETHTAAWRSYFPVLEKMFHIRKHSKDILPKTFRTSY